MDFHHIERTGCRKLERSAPAGRKGTIDPRPIRASTVNILNCKPVLALFPAGIDAAQSTFLPPAAGGGTQRRSSNEYAPTPPPSRPVCPSSEKHSPSGTSKASGQRKSAHPRPSTIPVRVTYDRRCPGPAQLDGRDQYSSSGPGCGGPAGGTAGGVAGGGQAAV